MWSSVILLTVSALLTATSAQNDFDAIQGCKQYTISRPSYNSPNPYYALDQFQDLQQVEVAGLKIRSIKIAVIGSNDGVIRLSPVEQPYQNTLMDEIVLSGWGNTRNAVRQYVRSSPSRYTRAVILANQLSGGILSPYKPFVFTLSIVNDHLVALSKNGESLPFLQYTDVGVTPKYIGFSNWNAPVSVGSCNYYSGSCNYYSGSCNYYHSCSCNYYHSGSCNYYSSGSCYYYSGSSNYYSGSCNYYHSRSCNYYHSGSCNYYHSGS
ncbi:hypothetical protein quinque_007571 [Culex quinquefasciatus]